MLNGLVHKYLRPCLLLVSMLAGHVAVAMIDIDAGDDATICYGSYVDMTSLGAYITGDVDDGIWFTTGDGIFLPSGQSSQIFSTATFYQPGPEDLANGEFGFILVSDDPDGQGPMVEVSDNVTVTLMSTPALVCNTSINVSLSETCEQEVDVFMLLANPQPPIDMYTITLYDETGAVIPDNILTTEHVGQSMTYIVGHACSSNTCNGTLSASDNISPFLNCLDATVSCTESAEPESVGLPIPFFATAVYLGDETYSVSDFDACGDVVLIYEDDINPANCSDGLQSTIDRVWTAVDVNGNMHSCMQHIEVTIGTLADMLPPPNYNDIDQAALECDGIWDALPNGHPAPSTTGEPTYNGCSNMQASFTDLYFAECGASFKIIRQWLVIDWCTSATQTINQTIKVKDSGGPVYNCPSDTVIGTQVYSCTNESFTAVFMEEVEDCSTWTYDIRVFDDNDIDQSAAYVQGMNLQNMEPGSYTLIYDLTDDCNNTSTCQTAITVIDDTNPFAICDQFTVASLSSDGTARLYASALDDGSYDNCAVVSMQVEKMTTQCPDSNILASYVDFCCEELGDTIMVRFVVTDASGLTNECMVEVRVEDKLPPEIYCPSDMTISCGFDFDPDDLSVFGSVRPSATEVQSIYLDGEYMGTDGYYMDNCTATIEHTSAIVMDCGEGTIIRTWTVTDQDDNSEECSQTITVINDQLLTADDILWPMNATIEGCDTLQADPTTTGQPVFQGEHCADPAYSYEDQVFYISGGACIKILRYWTAIDWCQYDATTGAGLWQYIQEIKLYNSIAPTAVSCTEIVACDYDDCGTHELMLTLEATDDCTAAEYLTYEWELDIDADGTIDYVGSSAMVDETVPYGNHQLAWSVRDGCGNSSTCSQSITVRDCKLPTPYCLGSVTTTVMPSAGAIDIDVEDFNLGATDNCTPEDSLLFSFSTDIDFTTVTLTCDDIPNGVAAEIELQVWVTDLAGNQDYCTVKVILQDNGDACLDGTTKGDLRGTLMSSLGEPIPAATVSFHTNIEGYSGEVTADSLGQYHISGLPRYLSYGLVPSYDEGPKGDINVLDIVSMQRHILQLDTIDNPYDLIAADVSGNNRVQASDLLIMKRYLLGISQGFTKVPKWQFIPASYEFPDALDPFGYVDSLVIDRLEEDLDSLDFVAIRMGNVRDGNTLGFQNGNGIEKRTANSVVIETIVTDDKVIELTAATDFSYDGLQMALQSTTGQIFDFESSYFSADDYSIIDGQLHIVSASPNTLVSKGQLLGTVYISEGAVTLGTAEFASFVVEGEELIDISLGQPHNTNSKANEVEGLGYGVLANPFMGDLVLLGSSQAKGAELKLLSADGALLYQSAVEPGTDQIVLPAHLFPAAGVYVLLLESGAQTSVVKVIKI